MDLITQEKWDRAAGSFDMMSANGPEKRWRPAKLDVFSHMRPDAKILFMALGTGLDIEVLHRKHFGVEILSIYGVRHQQTTP